MTALISLILLINLIEFGSMSEIEFKQKEIEVKENRTLSFLEYDDYDYDGYYDEHESDTLMGNESVPSQEPTVETRLTIGPSTLQCQ